jgi:hypothetical protein
MGEQSVDGVLSEIWTKANDSNFTKSPYFINEKIPHYRNIYSK